MVVRSCAAAGLRDDGVAIKINSRKLLNGLLAAAGVASESQRLAALRAVDKLDRLGAGAVAALLGAGRRDESGAFTPGAALPVQAIDAVMRFVQAGRPSRSATLDAVAEVVGDSEEGQEGLGELQRIGHALDGLGVSEAQALFDPSVVRGLEYYTGAVFEAQLTGAGLADPDEALRFGSIGGGGRYDDLVSRFTGERLPATGFSFGVSRLAGALAAGGAANAGAARGPVVVLALEATRMADYFALAAELRAAGIAAEVYLGESGMRAQMKYADRRLAPAAVILGEDEIAKGAVTIKDLDLGRTLSSSVSGNQAWREDRPGQVTVPRGEWIGVVRRIAGLLS